MKALLARILPQGRIGKGIAAMAGGSALGQIATVLALPILSRQFSRHDFGLLAVYVAIVSNFAIISGGRYEQAVPIAEDDEQAANSLAAAIICTFLMAATAAVILLIWGRPILMMVKAHTARGSAELFTPLLWLIPLGLLLQGLNLNISYWATRRQHFQSLGRRRASMGIATAVLQLGSGFLKLGPVGLLFGYGLGQGTGGTALVRTALKEDRAVFARISMVGIRAAMKRFAKFPRVSVPAAFLNSLALNLPAILMARYYGQEANGDLGQALRVMALPIALVGAAVGQAFLGTTPQLLREDPEQARAFFTKITRKLASMSIGIVALGIAAIWLAPLVLGAKWDQAGIYMALIGFAAACQFMTSPISQITTIVERQDLQLAGDLVRSVLIFLAFWLTYTGGGGPIAAIAAYAATMVVTYLGFFVMYRWLLLDAVNRRLQVRDVPVSDSAE